MNLRLRRQLRLLHLYAILSLPLLILLLFTAFLGRPSPEHFEEISVERINVLEPDGTLKLVISSSARQAEGTIGGEEIPIERTRPAGMIFFNDFGDEIGGLLFLGDRASGAASLTFDQAGQDQVIGFRTEEWTDEDGHRRRTSGLSLWDRPQDQTVLDVLRLVRQAEAIDDPTERERRMAELQEAGMFGFPRAFFGRTPAGQVHLNLRDGRGDVRLRLSVEDDGTATIEFLDSAGNVVRAIGPEVQ